MLFLIFNTIFPMLLYICHFVISVYLSSILFLRNVLFLQNCKASIVQFPFKSGTAKSTHLSTGAEKGFPVRESQCASWEWCGFLRAIIKGQGSKKNSGSEKKTLASLCSQALIHEMHRVNENYSD